MADLNDKYDEMVVLQLTYDPIVAHSITPESSLTLAEGFPEIARILRGRNARPEVIDNLPADASIQPFQISERALIDLNRPAQVPAELPQW